jgi:sec-independent protein translocase protein TatA
MGGFSIWHMLIVLVVVVLIFGAGRLPNVMGDFAKGIKAFRAGMREEEPKPANEQANQTSIPQGAPNESAPGQTISGDRKVG